MEHHKDLLKDLCRLCSSKVIPNKGYKNPKAVTDYEVALKENFHISLPEDDNYFVPTILKIFLS